jgi:transposase
MSASFLYHALGIRSFRYVRTDYESGEVRVRVELPRDRWRCSHCKSEDVVGRGSNERELRTTPLGRRRVFICLAVPKVECRTCSRTAYVALGFAERRRSFTRAFERYVIALLGFATVRAVARHLGVSWDLVKEIHRRHLKRRFSKPRLRHLRVIAIDEVNIGRGRFLTLVLDLKSGAVVYVGEGRTEAALEPFWRRLRSSRACVEAVAIDMSNTYRAAVRKNLPKAVVVFDRFHIMKHFNKKLSEYRQVLQRTASPDQRSAMRGTRWLLVMNKETLVDNYPERIGDLERALQLNRPLATAYYLKEVLRHFWQQDSRRQAEALIRDWMQQARGSGVPMLERFANTIEVHLHGILAWYEYPISTGPLEGVNNKLKTLQKQAYGYRDDEYFKLRILGLHVCSYALTG